jgi:murein L,D-transpeptidase YafK/ketosteroid isomerase-like protein
MVVMIRKDAFFPFMPPAAIPPVTPMGTVTMVVLTVVYLTTACFSQAAAALPDMLISMPYADGAPAHAIVVEKDSQRLSVFRYDGTFRKVGEFPCSTGKAHGDKRVSGDMKTPEGVYFFTDHHRDRDLSPIYGTRAFPMNYPNVMDRQAGKGGFAIWLHGTDRPLVANDSNGCVAMRNADIDFLAGVIDVETTPILVTDIVSYADPADIGAYRERLDGLVRDWRRRLATGTYHEYLELYHPDYLPPISWWRDWQAFRKAASAGGQGIDVALADASYYRFRGTYVAAFRLALSAGGQRLPAGRRTLFIRDDQGLRIVGDEYLRRDAAADDADPLMAAVAAYRQTGQSEAQVAAFVQKWLSAWSSKDIEAYGACYSTAFYSKNKNKRQWIAYKASLNERYARIDVNAVDLSYQVNGDRAVVTFTQQYASDRYQSVGRKTLRLRRENHQWKIYRETYSGT